MLPSNIWAVHSLSSRCATNCIHHLCIENSHTRKPYHPKNLLFKPGIASISTSSTSSTFVCVRPCMCLHINNMWQLQSLWSSNERQLHKGQLHKETVFQGASINLLATWLHSVQSPSSSHPSAGNEALYWPKCILHSGWLCITSFIKKRCGLLLVFMVASYQSV